jgi:hypothetical protein
MSRRCNRQLDRRVQLAPDPHVASNSGAADDNIDIAGRSLAQQMAAVEYPERQIVVAIVVASEERPARYPCSRSWVRSLSRMISSGEFDAAPKNHANRASKAAGTWAIL